jgi:Na+-translocating ferredoxin:NAD+ oxidoreductase RnfG subunit
MKNLKYILLFAFIAVSLNAGGIKDKTENVIQSVYSSNVQLEFGKWKIPTKIKQQAQMKSKQKFYQDHLFYWKIKNQNSLEGIAVIDNVIGKSMPITFLVIFDPNGNIKHTEIIKYREPYGGGVQNRAWNKQFEGKDSDSSFKVGKEIQSISGATISVNSVTKGIKKLTFIFSKLKEDI